MRLLASLLSGALLLPLLGCGDTRRAQSALQVTVTVGEDVTARCVRVIARPEGGEEKSGNLLPARAGEALIVAVFASPELNGRVSVLARGYRPLDPKAGCDGTVSAGEESDPVEAEFVDGEVVPVSVKLDGIPAAFDADRDGFRGAEFGGDDCDDTRDTVFPGALELCDDRVDNDCDAAADCDEAFCANALCDDGDPCTTLSSCKQGVCGSGMPVFCTTPPGECFAAPGTCARETNGCSYEVTVGAPCSGGYCRGDGACVDETIEADCTDGVDNDHNGATDCADPDCDAQMCDDADACTETSVCQNLTCTKGPVKPCMQTENECAEQIGNCTFDGSCAFLPKAVGVPCAGGECRAGAVCGTSEVGPLCANGQDDDGDGLSDCADASCLGSSCNDSNACTMGETCVAPSSCGMGTAVTCTFPGQCQAIPSGGMMCNPATGCVYDVTPDAPCLNGYCTATGSCAPPFPYNASNFTPATYAPAQRGGPYIFDCGVSTFDSTPNAMTPFQNWCNQTPPQVFTVSLPNGLTAVVLPMKGLSVNSGATLQLRGTRPVILAVYGNATIAGDLNADAVLDQPGPGASTTVCGTGVGNNGTTANSSSGGGGGGSFATDGAGGGNGGTGSGGQGGAAGVAAFGVSTAAPLRGGCNGGSGATVGSGGGAGGGGGGALQLSASGTLTVTGRIHAVGGGGQGGQSGNQRGGGGGGSGGAVLLEAQSASFSAAVLSVTGGGGGEGVGTSATGGNGEDGFISTAGPATGGAGASIIGGNGGNGAYPGTAAQPGFAGTFTAGDGGGGGGGGGGLGVIRVNASGGCSGASSSSFRGIVSSLGANCP